MGTRRDSKAPSRPSSAASSEEAAQVGPFSVRERELLERHKPVLRFDPQYDYRVLAAESAADNPGNVLRRQDGELIARAAGQPTLSIATLTRYPGDLEPESGDCLALAPDYLGDARRMEWEEAHTGRMYGRVVQDGERTWLQYWFWLYYNPKNLFGFGKHEGDWEMVQVGLGKDDEPEVATYAQHDSGEARPWHTGAIEFSPEDPRRPVVYVAPRSHASYFEPGTHPYLLGIDHPFRGGPAAAELPVVPFAPWASWPGHWGSTERTVGGRIGNGPRSPCWQGEKWERPHTWHQRMRNRRLRVRLGRAMHALGGLTYPLAPRITRAETAGARVRVDWELEGRPVRRGRHLHLTLHARHFVVASRIVEQAATTGATTLAIPANREPTSVMASTFNRLRQRSDPVELPVVDGPAPG